MSLKKAIDFAFSPIGAIIGGKVGDLLVSASMMAGGILLGQPALIGMGVARAASAFKGKPKVSPATLDRLNADIVVDAPRKGAVGLTALNTDGRYGAYTGANQEFYELILAAASHEIEAYESVFFDTEQAWTLAGGAQGRFAGYLTVTPRTVGTSSNGIAIDSVWTAACTLTGCAYLHFKFRLTGLSKKAESPFANSIPTRITIRGKGAKVPDPRLSTSAGGSGSQNMADQTTWAYTTAADSGRNPACQLLFGLLGWRINGKLAVGLGWPAARIDFASFIAAANICDESVAKLGGGTRPRYRSDGVLSEGDSPDTWITGLLQAMNAELTDENGKVALRIDYDDLATPVVALTEDDIIDGDDWPLSDSSADVNIVKGQYVDPSDAALYQMRDYPQVSLAGADYGSPDGIQRIDPLPLPFVQDPEQAQHLAALRLQRHQYPGTYSARFKKRAWAAAHRKIVTLTHPATAMSAKKWRVRRQRIRRDGSVDLVLGEVASAMYSAPSLSATVAAAAPTPFNPLNHPLAGNPVTYRQSTDPALAATIWEDDRWVNTGVTPNLELVWKSGAWRNAANLVTLASDIGVAQGATAGKNLILNSGAESGAVAPWTIDEFNAAGSSLTADAAAPASGKYRFL
ncbi:MAG TPA: phage tail protein, partial [Allosphingosinicella sp.]|nr:phage tail protein [Allosphingosinicella sp.]